MRITIQSQTIEINSTQLKELNEFLSKCVPYKEKYNSAKEEYDYIPMPTCRVVIEEVTNVVTRVVDYVESYSPTARS